MEPKVQCPHWSWNGGRDNGDCARGLYGGRPSAGVCARCEFRDADGEPRTTLAGLVRDHAARRAGCPSCKAKHEAAMAARRAAK